jgi:hypothetical protein
VVAHRCVRKSVPGHFRPSMHFRTNRPIFQERTHLGLRVRVFRYGAEGFPRNQVVWRTPGSGHQVSFLRLRNVRYRSVVV